MTSPLLNYNLVLELLDKETRASLGKTAIEEPDLDPLMHGARFQALRRRLSGSTEFHYTPVFSEQPYMEGLSVFSNGQALVTAPMTFFGPEANRLATQLAKQGKLKEDADYLYRVAALPTADSPVNQSAKTSEILFEEVEDIPRDPEFREGLIDDRFLAATTEFDSDFVSADEFPVYIAQSVLDQVSEQVAGADGREIGGFLIGHLTRNSSGDVALVATAQVPALHANSKEMSLTFVPRTWAALESTIKLRGKGEQCLGFHHLHPAKSWCENCARQCTNDEELRVKMGNCPYQTPFFSTADVQVMRTAFPFGWQVGLLAVDTTLSGIVFSLFAWKQGRIARRGFHVFDQNQVEPVGTN